MLTDRLIDHTTSGCPNGEAPPLPLMPPSVPCGSAPVLSSSPRMAS